MHYGALEGQIFEFQDESHIFGCKHPMEQHILCAYLDIVGRGDVTDRDMRFHIKFASAKLGHPSRNIPLYRIGTHANQAGGACAMKLVGFYDESIKKMGRWLPLSNAFL